MYRSHQAMIVQLKAKKKELSQKISQLQLDKEKAKGEFHQYKPLQA
jgi:hypothetical protein